MFCYTRSLSVSTVMKQKTRQDFVTLSTIPLCTLCYYGMFKYSKWKPALALLITRNALSEYPSKTWVLKSMPSRSHKACELFVLAVQPVCLRSGFRGRAKLSVLQGKGMCKNGEKGWRKKHIFGETFFKLQSTGTVLQSNCHSSRHKWNFDLHINEHECTHVHKHTLGLLCKVTEGRLCLSLLFDSKSGKLLMAVEILLVVFPQKEKQKQEVLDIYLHCGH